MDATVGNIAATLLNAEKSKIAVPPITSQFTDISVTDAYNVQLEIVKTKLKEGRAIIGKKVGLTSVAMQKMLGVEEPDYGHLLDDMKVENGGAVMMSNFLSPKIEAEIGFVLADDLNGPNVTFLDVLMATKYVVPTLEIIDSRIADWKIGLVDTVADNGSSAKVVVGEQVTDINGLDLRSVGMILSKNGEMIATGSGAAALGHPAHAIAWLANKLHEFGIPLRAGELILPGALSAAVSVSEGDTITAQFGPLGSVSVTFEQGV
ncbi:2-keto-4-pentenoate hydratase [[Bacillus] enclensis]|jgi:2-keto-4-pentenoate hydratase|uniref:2-keto-4-pentenoate hydratase n=1 Tax=[Bacillus] enclensis TaxID=1402860 RepID=A0A0V8HL84_9BACI|nr:2-keto-4-pentenoate hydratase [[Bacillus] enclensis]KSU63324.1 2-keto-4-pentenoate hydratase [[Bacillus] enclensis]OAT83884.1 2-keto-4-pentenoate hydratase [Bacillus sp. MKU004]QTC43174.1 fumarylacetoacetate hydrolase family protein [Bacillus sp. V3]SCB81905.1 2-keto-4-pentenoate hydratase [[Bacillus] enclensis]